MTPAASRTLTLPSAEAPLYFIARADTVLT